MNTTGEINLEEGFYGSRRKFLQLSAGIGIGLSGFLERVEGEEVYTVVFKVLDENDRFDIGDRGEEMIEKAYTLGHQYEKAHGG